MEYTYAYENRYSLFEEKILIRIRKTTRLRSRFRER